MVTVSASVQNSLIAGASGACVALLVSWIAIVRQKSLSRKRHDLRVFTPAVLHEAEEKSPEGSSPSLRQPSRPPSAGSMRPPTPSHIRRKTDLTNGPTAQPTGPCTNELVTKLVLTGGPCGGKTTALARLKEYFESRGFRVFIAPEAATNLFTNGMSPSDLRSDEDVRHFQVQLMAMQIFFEDCFARMAARTGVKSVVICDRALMDGKAYSSPDCWREVLLLQGLDETSARDARYNGVFHLTTAANGAEAFYTSENNPARSEEPDAARALDDRIKAAWQGHPFHVILHNEAGGFEGKMRCLISEVSRLVGLPTTTRKARKFLLSRPPSSQMFLTAGIVTKVFTIEKIYPLRHQHGADEEGGYSFVRRRASEEGYASYGETRVLYIEGEKVETKRVLSEHEYAMAMQAADPARHIIRTVRTNFTWGKSVIYMEKHLQPFSELCILYVQTDPQLDQAKLQLPPFIEQYVEAEVTGQSEYSSYSLSLVKGHV